MMEFLASRSSALAFVSPFVANKLSLVACLAETWRCSRPSVVHLLLVLTSGFSHMWCRQSSFSLITPKIHKLCR